MFHIYYLILFPIFTIEQITSALYRKELIFVKYYTEGKKLYELFTFSFKWENKNMYKILLTKKSLSFLYKLFYYIDHG